MGRKRFRNLEHNVIPRGLRFFDGNTKIPPVKIKAVVQDFCDKRQQNLDKKILEAVKEFPPIMEADSFTIPKVRAVDFKSNSVNLVEWLNLVYTGHLFSDNPKIRQREPITNPQGLSNHQLWELVSEILIAEFWHTAEQDKEYKPRIDNLVFRDKRDFFAGSWGKFRKFWDPFIDMMDDEATRDEIRESLKFGVDTASFSRPFTEERPAFFRTKRKPVVTKPVFSDSYHRERRGRNPKKYDDRIVTRIRHGKVVKLRVPKLLGTPVAYRPVLLKEAKKQALRGIFPSSMKALECQETIADKLIDWLKQRAIEYVGPADQVLNSSDLSVVNTILPLVVERSKPRLCLDGGPHLAVGSEKKIECVLDTVSEVMNNLKKDDVMCKSDDSNGFFHAVLDDVAMPMHGFTFGNLCFRAKALPFGLSISPGKFQGLNRVAVTALVKLFESVYLYLDDRITHSSYKSGFSEGETTKAAYMLACLMVAFGGFCSLDKSQWEPSKVMEFLGLLIDSRDLSISVPEKKYLRCMQLMQEFYEGRNFDIKLLEKIRGKLTSWLLVCPNMQLFLREQNAVIAEAYKTGVFTWTEEMLSRFRVFEELMVWKDLRLVSLKRFWSKETPVSLSVDVNMYTDASNFAGGANLWSVGDAHRLFEHDDYFVFDEKLAGKPIHCKEIQIILWELQKRANFLRNRTVTVWCDNQGVVFAFARHGGRDVRLSRVLKQVVELCHFLNITLRVEWTPTYLQKADAPSREIRLAESKLRPEWANLIIKCLNPNLDLFANFSNKLRPQIRYGSEYDDGNSVGNGLSYTPKESDRIFVFCPLPIQQLVLHNVIPQADWVIMVVPVNNFDKAVTGTLKSLFEGFITLGNGAYPAILRPAKNLASFDGETKYFTGDLQAKKVRLYFKGVDGGDILRLRDAFFRAEGLSGVRRAAFKWARSNSRFVNRTFSPQVVWF